MASRRNHAHHVRDLGGRLIASLCLFALTGCGDTNGNRFQGYAEGEFVYVSAPVAGQLESLAVARGQQVRAGELLFTLQNTPQKAARDEAEQRLQQARATLADLQKGKRPTEVESLEAQLKQAQTMLRFSEQQFQRIALLVQQNATTQDELARVQATRDQDRHRVTQFSAELTTARLGARGDQVAAAQAEVHAREASLVVAAWNLSETTQSAAQSAEVFDTLYEPGEWVAAGRPAVVLLPAANIKVRTFVPEPRIGGLNVGQTARVYVDGITEPLSGKVRFISPREEFTPPVIYSRESRSKLVYMVELSLEPETAVKLKPGQPVDVELE